MNRGTWVYRSGELVPKSLAAPLFTRGPQSDLPSPMLNLDTIAPFKSMADGKMYDSKSSYRKTLKAGGYTEIGNEIPAHLKEARRERTKPRARGDLTAAYQKVRQGYRPQAPVISSIGTPDLD